MEIDKSKLLEKLNSMSDEELKSVIKSIAQSAGVSDRKADRVLKNVGKIRRGMENLSDREFNGVIGRLDGKTLDAIKKQLD